MGLTRYWADFFLGEAFCPFGQEAAFLGKRGGVSKRIYKERIGKITGKIMGENKR
jgi:hypothetical protein